MTEKLVFRSSAFIPVQPPNAYAYPPPMAAAPGSASASSTHRPVTEAELVLVPEIDIEEILGHVEAVIPDIELDAARRTVTAMNPIPSTNDIVTHFLDHGYTKKAKKSFGNDSDRPSSLKRSWSEIMDDIPRFLASYADPVSYFAETQRKQSESYINHAKAFLLRAFPTTDKSILEQALQEENFHFLPTIRKLETRMGLRTNAFLQRSTIRRSLDMLGKSAKPRSLHIPSLCLDLSVGGVGRMPSASWLIKNNKFAYAIPHTPCEEFYDELRYAKNEVKIRRKWSGDDRLCTRWTLFVGYLGKVSKEHEKRVKKAKKGNETLECDICCREDLLIDDMVECTVGHLYCRSVTPFGEVSFSSVSVEFRNCVRTHIDVCFKEGKCRFACVESSCPGEYSMPLISELLPPKDLNRLNRRIQEENIRQGNSSLLVHRLELFISPF